MTRSSPFPMPSSATYDGQAAAQERIERQGETVASLLPGTEHHRLAMSVLLLLKDSMVVMAETQATIAVARADMEERNARRSRRN